MIKARISSNCSDNVWIAKKHGEWDATFKPNPDKLKEGDFVIITTGLAKDCNASILVKITKITTITANNPARHDWINIKEISDLKCKLEFEHIFTLDSNETKKYLRDNFSSAQAKILYKKTEEEEEKKKKEEKTKLKEKKKLTRI